MESSRGNLIIFVMLRFLCLTRSETTIDITVEGAIQTGIGKYVAPVGQMLQFGCRLRQFPNARLWILRRGPFDNTEEVLLDRTFSSPGLTEVTYRIAGDSLRTTTGNYSCRFHRSITRRGSSPIQFTAENTVEITAFNQNELPRCSSSLGLTGLPGEQATVFCGTHDGHTAPVGRDMLWRGMDTTTEEYGSYNFYFAKIPLDNQPSDLSCGYFEISDRGSDWEEFCSLPPIKVLTHMELTMEPSQFDDRNDTLRFTCQSNPPSASIRWSVFGHNENILSDYYTTRLEGEFRANVTQGFGISTMEISSSSVRTDGVHLVTCSTTRENYKIAVSQYSEPPLREPTARPTPKGVTKQYSSPTGVYSANASQRQSSGGFITVIVLLLLIVVALGVLTVWLYRKYRKVAESNNGTSYPHQAGGLSVAQRSATYEPLNRAVTVAPPAYADLDAGYSTMGPPPSLDDQHYMEPSISPSKDSSLS